MKYRLVALLVVFMMQFLFTQETGKNPGYLSFESNDSMTVILNDTIEIRSPIHYFPLDCGEYRLKAGLVNDRNWYSRPITKTFVIKPNDSLIITLVAMPYRLLQSVPSDAWIRTQRDSIIGKTPFILNSKRIPDFVYVEKTGYVKKRVSMEENDWPKVVMLRRDDTAAPLFPSPALSAGRPFYKRHFRTGLVATAIAANWLSFYMKRRADDYYSKYQTSSSLNRIRYYYDKTERYDLYTSILLGVSTTATFTYLYMLIRD